MLTPTPVEVDLSLRASVSSVIVSLAPVKEESLVSVALVAETVPDTVRPLLLIVALLAALTTNLIPALEDVSMVIG